MNEELEYIDKNRTWELVQRTTNKNVIEIKWVFQNKLNKNGQVVRNKARSICKGYAQVEGINFEKTFASIVRLEESRIFISFLVYKNFKVYQIDVKSTLLNGRLEEKVYIKKLDGFQLGEDPNLVCKIKKVLYGIKYEPRVWYSNIDTYHYQ